jgi:hypothetical protein
MNKNINYQGQHIYFSVVEELICKNIFFELFFNGEIWHGKLASWDNYPLMTFSEL